MASKASTSVFQRREAARNLSAENEVCGSRRPPPRARDVSPRRYFRTLLVPENEPHRDGEGKITATAG
jgi:hypothetical protein